MSNKNDLKNVATAVALEAMIYNCHLEYIEMYDLSSFMSMDDGKREAIIKIKMHTFRLHGAIFYMANKLSDIVIGNNDFNTGMNRAKILHSKSLAGVREAFNRVAAKIEDIGKEIIEVLGHTITFDDDKKSCLIEIKCSFFTVLSCPVPKKDYDNKQRFINCANGKLLKAFLVIINI